MIYLLAPCAKLIHDFDYHGQLGLHKTRGGLAPGGYNQDELQQINADTQAEFGQKEDIVGQHLLQHTYFKDAEARKVHICGFSFLSDRHGSLGSGLAGSHSHDTALLLILAMARSLAALEGLSVQILGVSGGCGAAVLRPLSVCAACIPFWRRHKDDAVRFQIIKTSRCILVSVSVTTLYFVLQALLVCNSSICTC